MIKIITLNESMAHMANAFTQHDEIKEPITKEQTVGGNTLYTVQYQGVFITPSLTKLLLDNKHKILAYIDIQYIPQTSVDFVKSWQWFNIQEYHPELIGAFKHEIQSEQGMPFLGDVWDYNPIENLYTLSSGTLDVQQHWYKLDDDTITTNYINGMSRTYKYNTRPSKPTDKIERLTKHILYTDGVITKKEFNKYMRNERKKSAQKKWQKTKRQLTEIFTNVLTRKK